jgi:protein-disulfide isomerase
MFAHQDALEDEDLERYAVQLGLDLERFKSDMASADTQSRIDADKAEGRRVHVEGTPTIFVNGRHFTEPPTQLANYLRQELEL